jgi:hypothetical protein
VRRLLQVASLISTIKKCVRQSLHCFGILVYLMAKFIRFCEILFGKATNAADAK